MSLPVVVNPQRKCWLSVQNTFNAVLLTAGKPGLNTGQFLTAIVDALGRRTNTRSALLEDLQKLYKSSWPPVDSEELILFGEESVTRLAKRFGILPTKPLIEAL